MSGVAGCQLGGPTKLSKPIPENKTILINVVF